MAKKKSEPKKKTAKKSSIDVGSVEQKEMFTKPKNKPGRKPGEKPEEVILFNRHNCLFYVTIKNMKGTVVARDYSVHERKVEKLQIRFARAQDTLTTKLLKAVKRSRFKEDVFKAIPSFFDFEKQIDTAFFPPGLFENEDNKISRVVDKADALMRLDSLITETMIYLNTLGASKVAVQLASKYAKMITEDTPIGRTVKQNPDVVQKNQLSGFEF